jgi:hypothetical protein
MLGLIRPVFGMLLVVHGRPHPYPPLESARQDPTLTVLPASLMFPADHKIQNIERENLELVIGSVKRYSTRNSGALKVARLNLYYYVRHLILC